MMVFVLIIKKFTVFYWHDVISCINSPFMMSFPVWMMLLITMT